MAKVIIHLRDHEWTALNDLAQREYRTLKAQAALIIREELHRLGMLPGEPLVQARPDSLSSDETTRLEMEGG